MAESRGDVGPGDEGAEDRGEQQASRPSPVMDRVRDRVNTALNARKDRASDVLADLAGSVRQAGEPLREGALAPLAGYADEAADRLGEFAAGLRDRDVTDLADDVRSVAKRYPAGFAAVAFGAGLLAARFWKSSAEPERMDAPHSRRAGAPARAAEGSSPIRPRAAGVDQASDRAGRAARPAAGQKIDRGMK